MATKRTNIPNGMMKTPHKKIIPVGISSAILGEMKKKVKK
jgi:hypothetical protein